MNFTLFVTAVLTGLGFVGLVTVLAKLLAPRSYNSQKEDPFECGIPTRGRTWMQFRVGYYLFAILFLMFDVETMFLFPWAVVMKSLGAAALASIVFFLFILVLGLAYAWKKGALEWQLINVPKSITSPTKSFKTMKPWNVWCKNSMRTASA